ncbi:MAG: hypothetical protein GXY37_03780 [Chloroflexi bacterium]|nr:hypothetical protein [Chloroflexota bacterium]
MVESLTYQIDNISYHVPTDRLYAVSGTWVQSKGCRLRIGLTEEAAAKLANITALTLPKVGSNAYVGNKLVQITTSDGQVEVENPLMGRIRAANTALLNDPSLIKTDPYGEGWFYEADPFNWEEDKSALLSPMDYNYLRTEDDQ